MAKAKTKTGNPFLDADMGNIMDFGKLAEQFKLPGVDTTALIESQQRNVDAMTKANQIAFAGVQAIMQRQAEILRETLDGTTKAVQAFSKTDKPEDIWAKQADLVNEAYEQLVGMQAKDLLGNLASDVLPGLESEPRLLRRVVGELEGQAEFGALLMPDVTLPNAGGPDHGFHLCV